MADEMNLEDFLDFLKKSYGKMYRDGTVHEDHVLIQVNGYEFDEVRHEIRRDISNSIQEFAEVYENNILCVTSRPDNEFYGWSLFYILKTEPLNMGQA